MNKMNIVYRLDGGPREPPDQGEQVRREEALGERQAPVLGRADVDNVARRAELQRHGLGFRLEGVW